jgi:murein DD-endopeptidase MepM/ murein hydrolase activator NlpD
MPLRPSDMPQTAGSFSEAGRTGRLNREFVGLCLGLLIALLTAILTVGGAGAARNMGRAVVSANTTPSDLRPTLPAAAPPSTAIAALPATTSPTLTSLPPSTPMASPSSRPAFPTPTSVPTQAPIRDTGQVIGNSVDGRPITAYRIGNGPLKVVLVGDIHGEFEANTQLLAQQLLEYFQNHADQVPAELSLWIIPTMNPDGLATGHRWNANDVDLNRNADTDLDGCAGNDWSPDTVGLEGPYPGAGGAYPFSEPEARAIRDFMADAWIAVFYHSAAGGIYLDTCQRHVPSARLAEVMSEGTGYPVPEEGWDSYPVTGDWSDYLSGEGVAAATVELTDHEDPEFERNLAGVQALLASAAEIISAEATAVNASHIWLDEANTGSWHYAENSFIHPIALEVVEDTAYLLDGGRVLALTLDQATEPNVILVPGDLVQQNSPLPEGVRVLEPLDLAADGLSLLALDRAGDVYRYDPATGIWAVERYDRPARDTDDHYYVALAGDKEATYLLETTHEQVWRFTTGQMGRAWLKLPRGRDVDLSSGQDGVYVLTRAMNGPTANLLLYRDAQHATGFQPDVDLIQPRQVIATDSTTYVLDRAGRRLLAIDSESGALQALHEFRDRRAVSAIWADPSGERLILAGRDTLYFYGEPERQATIQGGRTLIGPQPHDLTLLGNLRGLSVPIEGATLTKRDFQMPGAPRHYRLGVHEGIDFYGYAVGVPVNRHTPVRAVADGVVIRALVDYQPLTPTQAEAWAARSLQLGYTPPDVLDGYRGMQVWIDHGGGVVSRYAHLSSIQPGIVPGAKVEKGQIIAMVGNSGTPASLQSDTDEVHLHLELWVGNAATADIGESHFIGQFLRPIEAREWLERILR